MRHRVRLGLIAAVLWATALHPAAIAQPAFPRTADGHPNLSGAWDGTWSIAIEAASPTAKLELTDAEAEGQRVFRRNRIAGINFPVDPLAADVAERPNPRINGKLRGHMVVEPSSGRIPYTEAGLKAVQYWQRNPSNGAAAGPRDNPEDRSLPERCIALNGHPPLMYPHEPGGLRTFVQTPGYVLIHSETGSDTRIIRMNAGHQPDAVRSRLGDSVGRWEGDTLIVETSHFPRDGMLIDLVFQPPIQLGRDSVVVERFTPISTGELLYQFTIRDPAIYAGPWLAEYPLQRADHTPREYACHEANYGLTNILSGARIEEKTAPKR